MKKVHFRGIIPPVPTILDSLGHLDEEGMGKLIDDVISKGVHGLFFLGTAGEAAHLSVQQKLGIIDFAIRHTAGRVPVLIGTGCPSTQETMLLSRIAEEEGADGIVVVNPYFSPLSEENLFRHYGMIAESVTLPVFLYNFPALTKQDLTPQFVLRLALQYPNIAGVKDTVDTMSHIREMIQLIKPHRPDFAVFAGYDEYLLGTLMLGGDGAVPASANFAPQLTLGIWDAYHQGDWEAIQRWTLRLAAIPAMYKLDTPFVNAVKEAIRMCGLPISTAVLAPAGPLSAEKKRQLEAVLEAAEVLPLETTKTEHIPVF